MTRARLHPLEPVIERPGPLPESATERVRLFVALDLPGAVRGGLAAWARGQAGGVEGLRLLEEETLHVTLCFLGWRGAGEVEPIGRRALACAEPVPDLALAGAAWLPPRRPRVLAVDLDDGAGALARLQGRVAGELAATAGYQPERRPYRPHVTVARAGRDARPRPFDLDPPPHERFAGAALTLYRSHLRRAGARYEPVARTIL